MGSETVQSAEDACEIRSAAVRLRTTERGLPVAMSIAPQALSMPPDDLARHILALCDLSARRAQVSRRRRLLADGYPANVVDRLNLARSEDIPTAEGDEPPSTWLEDV